MNVTPFKWYSDTRSKSKWRKIQLKIAEYLLCWVLFGTEIDELEWPYTVRMQRLAFVSNTWGLSSYMSFCLGYESCYNDAWIVVRMLNVISFIFLHYVTF